MNRGFIKDKRTDPDRKADLKVALYILAYGTGYMIAEIIWLVWSFNQPEDADMNYSFYIFILIILVVELPILAIQIFLLYINKVVKMKPIINMDLGDISEYLQAQESYRSGNYEFEPVRNIEDMKIAYQEGKKFVFPRKQITVKASIWAGIFFLPLGLIISIIIFININSLQYENPSYFYPNENLIIFIILNGVFSGIGAIIAVPNYIKLKRLYKSFMVLDPKGFLKSSIWGTLRAYSWKDLKDVKAYSVYPNWRIMLEQWDVSSSPERQIHVTLPKGGVLKIKNEEYDLSECFTPEEATPRPKASIIERDSLVSFFSFELFALTFQYFFEKGKYGKSIIILETQKSTEMENKENLMMKEKNMKAEEIIYKFLMEFKGKAFTKHSLNNRCLELQQMELEVDQIENISKHLYSLGKIGMELKDNEIFFYFL